MNDRSSVSHVYPSEFPGTGAVLIQWAADILQREYFKQRALAAAVAEKDVSSTRFRSATSM
jgi:hypothetical protein